MLRIAGPVLRLLIVPAAVAVFAGFEVRHAGVLAAISVSWCVFVLCVFAIGAWGHLQLDRTRGRLRSLRSQRSTRTR